MRDFYTIVAIIFLVAVIYTGASIIGTDVSNNDNLDNTSKKLINDINAELQNDFQADSLEERKSNITGNTSFTGQDPFEREFLEKKSSGQKKIGIIDRLKKVPDLILLSIGIPEEQLKWIKAFLLSFLAILIGVATYKLILRGRIDS